MPGDLHTHSDASSDSTVTIEERIALAREAGLDVVAVTDHCAVNDWFDETEETVDGVTLISGVELNPCEGEFGVVHVLGLYVDPETMAETLAQRDGRWEYEDAIDDVHAAGGVAILAHPGRYDIDLDALVTRLLALGIDGIEVGYPYEEYTALAPEMPYTPSQEIQYVATEYDLLRTAGSDCHGEDHEHIGLVSAPDSWIGDLRRNAGHVPEENTPDSR